MDQRPSPDTDGADRFGRTEDMEIREIELDWVMRNLPSLRKQATGHGFLQGMIVVAVMLGLAAHVGGYLLASAAVGEPVELLTELLRSLGAAPWTGGVLVVLVQIVPEAKRRSMARYLAATEAVLREQGRLDGEQESRR